MATLKVRRNKRGDSATEVVDNGTTLSSEPTTTESTLGVSDSDISDGNSNVGDSAIDPASIADSGDSGTPARTRKRRADAGTKRNPRGKRTEAQNTQNLTGILLSLHYMGAALLKCPEIALDEQESERMSAAISRVNEFYDGIVIPEEKMVWINLIMVAGSIYGPRAVAIAARKSREKKVQPVAVFPTVAQEITQ